MPQILFLLRLLVNSLNYVQLQNASGNGQAEEGDLPRRIVKKAVRKPQTVAWFTCRARIDKRSVCRPYSKRQRFMTAYETVPAPRCVFGKYCRNMGMPDQVEPPLHQRFVGPRYGSADEVFPRGTQRPVNRAPSFVEMRQHRLFGKQAVGF